MLFIDADTVRQILPMNELIPALEDVFRGVLTRESVHRGRIDIFVPNDDPDGYYRWGTMEGASKKLGMHAIRMKSDVISYPKDANGDFTTEEKYCVEPGTYCGLVSLFSTRNGEPLAIINEGHLQHMRVAASGGIGIKSLAREDAETIGMYGSGGMARDFLRAALCVRPIRKVKVYSPTKEHGDAYAREMSQELEIEIEVMDNPRDVARGVDVIATCTDNLLPFLEWDWVEPGQHITSTGGNNWVEEVYRKADLVMSQDLPNLVPADGGAEQRHIRANMVGSGYAAGTDEEVARLPLHLGRPRAAGVRIWNWLDLVAGKVNGPANESQVTVFHAGGVKGLDLLAGGYLVYTKAKQLGLGREIPTGWFLQDVRD
ncbi:MAG TPA: ornithine cyclodeaminase family protein [Dehalococcoidia bacterium]|nr:ornithine cyclodeaminase family protein [Dehalococcoidia bacterium]